MEKSSRSGPGRIRARGTQQTEAQREEFVGDVNDWVYHKIAV